MLTHVSPIHHSGRSVFVERTERDEFGAQMGQRAAGAGEGVAVELKDQG